MRGWLGVWLGLIVMAPAAGSPVAAEEPATAAGGGLDFSMRARALGISAEPLPADNNLGLERETPTNGVGSTRLPQVTSGRERGGIYLGVGVCDPVAGGTRVYEVRADDPGTLPEGSNLRTAPGPRRLTIPGRP